MNNHTLFCVKRVEKSEIVEQNIFGYKKTKKNFRENPIFMYLKTVNKIPEKMCESVENIQKKNYVFYIHTIFFGKILHKSLKNRKKYAKISM